MKPETTFDDFNKVDLRIGTIVEVTDFPKAHNPAYQLTIDFGVLGIKKSSAQITDLYTKKDLLHKQIIAIVNFKKKVAFEILFSLNFSTEVAIKKPLVSKKKVFIAPKLVFNNSLEL